MKKKIQTSYRLIRKGFKRDLTREDMWEIDFSETSECVTDKLEFEWNQAVAKYLLKFLFFFYFQKGNY